MGFESQPQLTPDPRPLFRGCHFFEKGVSLVPHFPDPPQRFIVDFFPGQTQREVLKAALGPQ